MFISCRFKTAVTYSSGPISLALWEEARGQRSWNKKSNRANQVATAYPVHGTIIRPENI
jgi:hypothetical protein